MAATWTVTARVKVWRWLVNDSIVEYQVGNEEAERWREGGDWSRATSEELFQAKSSKKQVASRSPDESAPADECRACETESEVVR